MFIDILPVKIVEDKNYCKDFITWSHLLVLLSRRVNADISQHVDEYRTLTVRKGALVEKLINLTGIAGVVGGFGLMLFQGITFLMKGTWISYTVLGAIDKWSGSLSDTIAANPGLMDALQKCPLSAALIGAGFIFLWIASKMRGR
jgi:hypothetical protein